MRWMGDAMGVLYQTRPGDPGMPPDPPTDPPQPRWMGEVPCCECAEWSECEGYGIGVCGVEYRRQRSVEVRRHGERWARDRDGTIAAGAITEAYDTCGLARER